MASRPSYDGNYFLKQRTLNIKINLILMVTVIFIVCLVL